MVPGAMSHTSFVSASGEPPKVPDHTRARVLDSGERGGERVGQIRKLFAVEQAERCTLRPLQASVIGARTKTLPILGRNVALELGKPGTAAALAVFVVSATELTDGLATVLSPDFGRLAIPASLSIGLVVLAGVGDKGVPDLFALRAAATGMDGLAGVSVRALNGRLWVRLSRDAVQQGVSAGELAQATYNGCRRVVGVEAVEILIACGDDELVESLAPFAAAAQAEARNLARLRLDKWDSGECSETDCHSCEEENVCHTLRDVIRIQRRNGRAYVR